jgi:PIN domain nuclease of toxin-antitoxin system
MMRLLLDTNTWLWMTLCSQRLGPKTQRLLQDGKNDVYLSAISAWEVVIKVRLGKLEVVGEPDDFIRTCLKKQRIASLGAQMEHVLAVANLPTLHRDPFDRLLIAQAYIEKLNFVSSDERLRSYPITFIDARQ